MGNNPRIVYAVCSERQRAAKKGQYALTSSLGSAIDKAIHYAQKQKRRMYVVIVRW